MLRKYVLKSIKLVCYAYVPKRRKPFENVIRFGLARYVFTRNCGKGEMERRELRETEGK